MHRDRADLAICGSTHIRAPYACAGGNDVVHGSFFQVNQKQEWVLGCLERTKEYREQKPLSADLSESKRNVYIRKAKETITKRVSYFARLMGVSYRNITIREQKTRWGSCSSEKNLNFNWKLILAPPEVLDYVVVHELCHLKEMNHSKAFWDEVGKVMPEYETYKLWLKENGWKL